jgi:DnaJ-class molecular chaperone
VTCGNCNGAGTKTVVIFNTATHKNETLTETCLSCNGSGQVASR